MSMLHESARSKKDLKQPGAPVMARPSAIQAPA